MVRRYWNASSTATLLHIRNKAIILSKTFSCGVLYSHEKVFRNIHHIPHDYEFEIFKSLITKSLKLSISVIDWLYFYNIHHAIPHVFSVSLTILAKTRLVFTSYCKIQSSKVRWFFEKFKPTKCIVRFSSAKADAYLLLNICSTATVAFLSYFNSIT